MLPFDSHTITFPHTAKRVRTGRLAATSYGACWQLLTAVYAHQGETRGQISDNPLQDHTITIPHLAKCEQRVRMWRLNAGAIWKGWPAGVERIRAASR